MTVPQTESELDSTWASSILGYEVAVTDTEGVAVGSTFACQIYRVFLDGPPATMVVKLPVKGEIRPMLDAINAYGREILFYREVAPHLPVRTPKMYAAQQAVDSTDFVLALEDLTDCTAVDQVDGLSLAQAESAVDGLAAFHGWSWENPEILSRLQDSFWPVISEAGQALQLQYGQLFTHVWSLRRDAFAGLLDPAVVAIGDRYTDLQPTLVAELAEPRAITHGELRADNLFFDGKGQPVFFDFQTAQQECGIRELAYLLGTSVSPDLLGRYEAALIERYVDGLRQRDYLLERAIAQYRSATTYNLLWPVMASIRYEGSSDRGKQTLDDMVTKLGAAITRNH